MHIFNMSTTDMHGFKKIHWKLWEKLITQTLYRKAWRMDGQTGANLNAPDFRHGGIKKSIIYILYFNGVNRITSNLEGYF